ncbi:L,D-transpeptidase family protein [Bradyrhizobium sp. CCBAU 11361]|uniref:L,D-transpeptidase family protein n=1 Tax=Bradyrhizobium sp. CCBAU 11361 TaxID=1630812 RepID=UPI0023058609|nr:L,D-transpeptidase family protein [Bradyrhizobium sp. CCBAU 11361]MDA9495451.1 peptidoglycan-binding protein [Bradyrhizobium sp. CCBAU 11361]
MRDCLNHRAGFDRVLMTVAATFLTVSASSALAQDQVRSSAAELAIEAAIPRPEPANVPPPTASDIKLDTTATVQDSAKEPAKEAAKAEAAPAPDKVGTKPADVATTPASEAPKSETAKTEPAKADTATAPAAAATPAEPPKDVAKEQPASEPVKAASAVPAADQPVADKLKDIIGAKTSRHFDRKNERAAIEKFYGARDFAPVWTQGGSLTAAAKGVIARLKDAASDGLNPADYPVPDFAAATNPDALADAELKLTASMFDYARQAQSGRMHWSQVSADILYPEHPVDPSEVLTKVTTAADASAALDSYNPPQKLYKELKAKLAELRGQGNGPVIEVADGPALKYTPAGKKQAEVVVEDPRVPQLRAKLGITENASDTRYDATVAEAVRKFQNSAELKATGVLDDKTVKAINTPKRDRQIDTVLVNMERWRWLPRDLGVPSLGDAYVILNIPDYTLKVMQRGQQVWTTRVVTGKPGQHATPLLTETMKYITVNPTWNVPPSIVYNEYLPALQQDPTVLQRMGLKLEQNRDGSVHISQPPGEANALGRIRFNFPNKFLVYQHDTPDKNLFARDERAFSHGCMRVQNPDQYASVLLNIAMPNEKYTPERVRSMYGKSEIDLKFPTPIPVNITYQTAFVDDGGKLQFRKDVYGRDATMINILKNGRGKDLENIVAHSQPSYSRPATTLPSGVAVANNGGGFGSSGPNFFERLFGAPTPPPAPVGRRPPQRVFTR